MKPADNIKNRFKNSTITVGYKIDKKILDEALSALPHATLRADRHIWSTIMHSKITKLSGIAAVILIIATFAIVNMTSPKAWAIGQTIDALKNIQTVEANCYAEGFGEFTAYMKWDGENCSSFQCLGERNDGKLFGLYANNMYYWYYPGGHEIYQYDLLKSKQDENGAGAMLYLEAQKVAPAILPFAKTLLQTFRLLASEWEETYKIDERTDRKSVFVTCSYKPLSMSFEAVFDIETKLVVRAKVWENSTFGGAPDLVISKIVYNIKIEDERFDFEKRFDVPILPPSEYGKARQLLRKGLQLEEEGKLEEAIAAWQELYEKHPY